jgi:hypothetical protein
MLAAKISRTYNLPLLVDMRDGWSKWCTSSYASYLHLRLTLSLEKKLFKQAFKVITLTKQLAHVFKETHRFLDETNTSVISNGFDDAIEFEESVQFAGLEKEDRIVRINYIGSFYYNLKNHFDMHTPWYKKKGHCKV